MIGRQDFLRGLLGGLLAAVGGFTGVSAVQARPRRKTSGEPSHSPSATPESTPAASPSTEDERKTAKLRLWKVSDVSDVPVRLRFLQYARPESAAASPMEVQTTSYQFANYTEVPAGPQTIEVSAPNRPVVQLPLYLAADAHSTLLIRLMGSTLTAEWIDDTPGAPEAGCEFSAYNLLLASSEVQIDFGALMTAHLAPGSSSARMSGIRRAPYSVITSGVDGAGKSFHWTTEVDFRQYRKAALLIYPDAYGRIRPRVQSA